MSEIQGVDSFSTEPYKGDSASVEYPLKRTLDILLGTLVILVSTPLWLLFSIAIRLEDGAPVFYGQKRVGKNGQVFAILKFRTLLKTADQGVSSWQVPGQKWVTKVGGLLRQTALDELPQVLSILKGDMSFVGPRAMPVEEFDRFKGKIQGLEQRFMTRPGLTGLAQVYGKATRNVHTKLRYDLLYIKNQSLWLDIKLIAMSFWITFQGRWEDRPNKSKD